MQININPIWPPFSEVLNGTQWTYYVITMMSWIRLAKLVCIIENVMRWFMITQSWYNRYTSTTQTWKRPCWINDDIYTHKPIDKNCSIPNRLWWCHQSRYSYLHTVCWCSSLRGILHKHMNRVSHISDMYIDGCCSRSCSHIRWPPGALWVQPVCWET